MVASKPGEFGSEVSAATWKARSAANHAAMTCPSSAVVVEVDVATVVGVAFAIAGGVDPHDVTTSEQTAPPTSSDHTAVDLRRTFPCREQTVRMGSGP